MSSAFQVIHLFQRTQLFLADQCSELPTMVQSTMLNSTGDDVDNSDGESDSADSPEVNEESETDSRQKEKDKVTSLSLQQTIKEALKVAAAQRQLQRGSKVKCGVQPTQNLSFLAPFLLPGLSTASTSTSNNTVMYQVPQGIVYTNGEDSSHLFANSSDNQSMSGQLLFPFNSLSFQQNLLQMMSNAALGAQLDADDQAS
ncbi:hypothetical protein AB6A40_009235 [Gnathostoma spinigerum]|uniref:Uncharacterized protein n=1 Tax=Gnathostoma spinigerum TaxID=75299 RepID=A0ABD6EYH8_9BILA